MLWILFLLTYRRKKSNSDRLSTGPYAIDISELQNVSVSSNKSSKSSQNFGKYYIIFIKDKKSFFKSNLSLEFKNIFQPYNCISPLYFRSYLSYEEMLKLQKSQYISILEIPKQFKFHETKINKKRIGNSNKKLNDRLQIQYLVQATKDFPKHFNKYGTISKMFEELYSFTIAKENISQVEFNNYVESIKNDLIDSDFVFKFEISPNIKPLNRFAIGFAQTGNYEMKNYNNLVRSYNPLHELSITGTNEVITISDSGVSPNIAWFVDSNNPDYPYNKYDSSQRKIIYYQQFSNRGSTDKTDYSGHGTHVAGTALGKSENPNKLYSLFDGAAPDAKAIIVDLEDGYGNMYIDIQLENTLNRMKQYNSFINTNSWGAEADSLTVNLLYNFAATTYPEILFVFASGNYERYQSIYSPGSVKNVLTVGALGGLQTTNLNSSQTASGKSIKFEVLIDNEKQKLFSASSLSYEDNNDNNYIGFSFKSIISEMSNKDGIDTIYNSTILLYDQNEVDFTDKAVIISNCNEATDSLIKNAKVIITKSSNDLTCLDKNLQQKAFGLELSLTNSQLQLLVGKKLTITPQINSNEIPSVSYFSSRGPNYLGGIKPEIVAPGTSITSASRVSSSIPQLAVMSGTSMSTPLVAGAMATLHQYLREKIGLSNNKIHSHLMKAIAIASADKPNPKVPDFDYGFGRLNLANVIPEITSSDKNPELHMVFLTDLKFESESVYIFSFEVTAKDKYDVRVAFSYLDDSTQTSDSLIIKANMNVQTPDKNLLFPLGDELEDSFSSVERIYIPKEELSNGIYTVIISTSESAVNSVINASIVVTGAVRNFRQISDNEYSSIQNIFDWSQYCKTDNTLMSSDSSSLPSATNNYHECNCNQYSSGLLCQFKSKPILFGHNDIIRLGPFETCYFYSTLDTDSYSNILFNWEQSNNQQNYIMLRLNIESNKKRLSQYRYHFYSNKTKAGVSGPANSKGDAILYEKGTLFFFTYTNYGQSHVTLTVSNTIVRSKGNNSPIGVSISVSLYLVIMVIVLVVIIIVFITCRRRRRRNAQIDGATSSSVSSSSGENENHHRNSNNNVQQRVQQEQTYQPQQFYGSIPSYTYGNQIPLNPYYNDMNYNYDPNTFPQPTAGPTTYSTPNNAYYPSGENDSNNEQAPQYYPPAIDGNAYGYNNSGQPNKDDDPNAPEPINPYLDNTYYGQQFGDNKQNTYDY